MDDDQFVQRGMQGDGDAFSHLFQRYHQLVCKIIYPIVHNEQDMEDVAAITWKRAWEKLPTLRDRSSFKSWLTTIAKNAARDYLRRNHWREGDCDQEDEELVDPVDFEDERITLIAFEEVMQLGFRRMRSKQRKCFAYHIQGWKREDIARKLGLDEETVKTYISKAFRILREELCRRRDGDQNNG